MRIDNTYVAGAALIYLALGLLVFPLPWIIAGLLAAAVHEAGHLAALRVCGGKVGSFHIQSRGAYIHACGLYPWQEILCVLAGPLCGLSLLLVSRWFPRTALCAAFQSVFNLLPIYPLDGGRAVRCIAGYLPKPFGLWIYQGIEHICLISILLLGFYGTFLLRLGILPLLFAIFVFERTIQGKRPCKAVTS